MKKRKKLTPRQRKRNELVDANMGLATHFAKHFQASRMEYVDLVQEAYMGLLDAAEQYDSRRGEFSTYARWHIVKRVMYAIHNTNEIVRTPRRRPSHVCNSLDDERVVALVDPAPDVGDVLDEAEMVDEVRAGIKLLPSREALVIRMRRGVNTLPLTLREVGDILAVTPERVRQIQNSGEEKLRAILTESAILRDHGAERPGA